MIALLPYALTVVGVAALLVAGRHPVGWALLLVQQACYLAFGLLTENGSGFIFHSVVYTVMAAVNYWHQRGKRLVPIEPALTGRRRGGHSVPHPRAESTRYTAAGLVRLAQPRGDKH
jgi:hypothetical protein